MKIDKTRIRRILLITLTNIGDIILTTPLISVLSREFPKARLDVMTGPLGRDIFINHPKVFKVVIYNKHLPLQDKKRLVRKLRKIGYDLVVDLRNSLFPLLIGSRYRTSPIQAAPRNIVHKKDAHLWKLKSLGIEAKDEPFSLHICKKDEEYTDSLLNGIGHEDMLIAICPSAKSLIKRWRADGFSKLSDRLIKELGATVVFVGDDTDRHVIDGIKALMNENARDLSGLTTIPQLAHLLKRARLLITNDSAPMHAASAVGSKVLAIFGPTDPRKYGPRGRLSRVIKKGLSCSPCERPQCRFGHECMNAISADEVYEAAREMLK